MRNVIRPTIFTSNAEGGSESRQSRCHFAHQQRVYHSMTLGLVLSLSIISWAECTTFESIGIRGKKPGLTEDAMQMNLKQYYPVNRRLDYSFLETTSESDNASFGTMFNVKAATENDYNLVIYGITGINMNRSEKIIQEPLLIFTRPGTYEGNEFNKDEWVLVVNTTIGGDEIPWVEAPDFFEPVVIPSGKTQAFYVTLAHETLFYTSSDHDYLPSGARLDEFSNKDIEIFVGVSVNTYPPFMPPKVTNSSSIDPGLTPDRIFNGRIKYNVQEIVRDFGREITLETRVEGDNQNFGILFDIEIGENSAENPGVFQVTSLDFVTQSTDEVLVHVMTREGSFQENKSFKDENWKLVCEAQVIGAGEANPTIIPPDQFNPVNIERGATQAFLILLNQKTLVYTNDTSPDGIFASNHDMRVHVGEGVEPDNLNEGFKFYPYRGFNGKVHYRAELDGSPTFAPTMAPTTAPTMVPTTEPTMTPTMAPTMTPTMAPTTLPLVNLDLSTAERIRTQQIISLSQITGKKLLRMLTNKSRPMEAASEDEKTVTPDDFFDPYVLLYVENTIQNFLYPYLARNDPPIALSDVKIFDGVPPDAVKYTEARRLIRFLEKDELGHNDTLVGGNNNTSGDDQEIISKKGQDSENKLPSIDFYTTIDGQYNPPPNIDFNALVEEYFYDEGSSFMRQLKTGGGSTAQVFEEVDDNITLQRVSFSLPDEVKSIGSGVPSRKYGVGVIAAVICSTIFGAFVIAGLVLNVSCKKNRELAKLRKEEETRQIMLKRQQAASSYVTGSVVSASMSHHPYNMSGRSVYGTNESRVSGASSNRRMPLKSFSRLDEHRNFLSQLGIEMNTSDSLRSSHFGETDQSECSGMSYHSNPTKLGLEASKSATSYSAVPSIEAKTTTSQLVKLPKLVDH